MVHVGRKELTQERKKILREVLPKIKQQGTLSGHPEMGAGRCPLEKWGRLRIWRKLWWKFRQREDVAVFIGCASVN